MEVEVATYPVSHVSSFYSYVHSQVDVFAHVNYSLTFTINWTFD